MIIQKLDPHIHQTLFENFAGSLRQNHFMNWSKTQLHECLFVYQVWALIEEGFIQCALCVRPLDENWEILWIQTNPNALQKGFAHRLLDDWLNNASHSAAEVWLEVHEMNLPAFKLYEKLKFTKQSFRKNYYPDGAGAHVMRGHLGAQKRLS